MRCTINTAYMTDSSMLSCSGAAQSDEEAGRVCEALAHAGIVLKIGDNIFLRPQDVIEMVMRVSHIFFHIIGLYTQLSHYVKSWHTLTLLVSVTFISPFLLRTSSRWSSGWVITKSLPFMISMKQLLALPGMLETVHSVLLSMCGLWTFAMYAR